MALQITYTRDHRLRRLIVQIILDDNDLVGMPVSVNYTPRNFLAISQQLFHLAMVAEQLESLTTATEDDMSFTEILTSMELPDNPDMEEEDEDGLEEEEQEEENEDEDDDDNDDDDDEEEEDEDEDSGIESTTTTEVTDEDSE